jgi:predicted nucleotidyltransferase
MKPSFALDYHRSEIRGVVAAHRASNPRVFGSVVRGEDAEDSDLDLLIDPTPDMTPRALPEKFRAAVLAESIPV